MNLYINKYLIFFCLFANHNSLIINSQIFSIIGSLVKESKGLTLERVINKFRENDYEKIYRLFELHNYHFGYINELTRRTKNPEYI